MEHAPDKVTPPPPPPGHIWRIRRDRSAWDPLLELLGPKGRWGRRKVVGVAQIRAYRTGGDPDALQYEVRESATFILEGVERYRRRRDAIDSLVGTYYEDER